VPTVNTQTQPPVIAGLTSGSSLASALSTVPSSQVPDLVAAMTPSQQQALGSTLGVTVSKAGKDSDLLASTATSLRPAPAAPAAPAARAAPVAPAVKEDTPYQDQGGSS